MARETSDLALLELLEGKSVLQLRRVHAWLTTEESSDGMSGLEETTVQCEASAIVEMAPGEDLFPEMKRVMGPVWRDFSVQISIPVENALATLEEIGSGDLLLLDHQDQMLTVSVRASTLAKLTRHVRDDSLEGFHQLRVLDATASFLNAEVPTSLRLVRQLFVDRQAELEQAVEQCLSALADPQRKPMAVFGEARVGKSHLLANVTIDVQEEYSEVIRVRISSGLSDPRDVLRELFNQCSVALAQAAAARGMGAPEQGPLALLDKIESVYREAIAGYANEVELNSVQELSHLFKTTMGVSAKLGGLLPTGSELGANVSSERATQARHEQGRTLRRPLRRRAARRPRGGGPLPDAHRRP